MPDEPFAARPADPWAPPSSPPTAPPVADPFGPAWAPPGAPAAASPPASPGWGWAPPAGPSPPPGPSSSPYGAPGWPPMPPPPAPVPPKKSRLGLAVTLSILAGSLVIAVVAAGVIVFSVKSGPSYPDHWDPRVEFAVRFVEQEKGRPFEHPVHVDFLTVDEFERAVAGVDEGTSEEDRVEADRSAAVLRILGLVEGKVDLLAESRNLVGKGAAAYYSPTTEEVKVRGTDIDLYAKATIVHELTHAWQDQHYDLGRLGTLDDEAALSLRALGEGDASNVEDAWVATLSPTDRSTYEQQSSSKSEEAEEGISRVPEVMVSSFAAPYELGPYFLQGLESAGGNQAVDRVFETPPHAINNILQPWLYQDGNPTPVDVTAPAGPEGAEVVDEGTNGALLLYLMLADRIDPHDALAASDAWRGDAYEVTEQDGEVCMTGRIVADDAEGRRAMWRAVRDWSADLEHLRVEDDGDRGVTFEGCDPGESADLGVDPRSRETIVIPVVRVVVWADAMRAQVADDVAECRADATAAAIDEADLADLSAEVVTEARLAGIDACPD